MHIHSDRVFSIPDFISPAECIELIALAESHGFDAASVRTHSGPRMMNNVRNNQRAILEAPQWRDLLWRSSRNIACYRTAQSINAGRFTLFVPPIQATARTRWEHSGYVEMG